MPPSYSARHSLANWPVVISERIFFISALTAARAAGEIAILGGVADGIAHVIQAADVDQIDDQFHFVDAFEVRHFLGITGFDECFESGLDERGKSAAEDGLFAEEIGFAFVLESGFDDAAASAADTARPCEADGSGFASGILMDGEQTRNTAAALKFAAHQMAGAFGSDHQDIHILGRHDGFEMNIESVRRA
jgi:hypothetical protein